MHAGWHFRRVDCPGEQPEVSRDGRRNPSRLGPPPPGRRAGVVASANLTNLLAIRDLLACCQARWGRQWPVDLRVAGEVSALVRTLPPADRRLFAGRHVRLLGFVPEIDGFYRGIDLALAPVRVGTGINIKMVEALDFGVPVLSTVVGAKGLPVRDTRHRLLDIEALVAAMEQVAVDPEGLSTLAEAGRTACAQYHSTAESALDALLRHEKLSPGNHPI